MREIFERITEHFKVPIRVGSRCEANIFYRVDQLSPEDLKTCGDYVAERVLKVIEPNLPEIIINLPGGYTGFAEILAQELALPGEEPIEVIPYAKLDPQNGKSSSIRGKNLILVSDVITTARSCLEAHTRVTMLNARVLCWASLIDRTFGPGPVPVVASFTGDPVRLLEDVI
ncbi:phosphoribosyltransferase [bacterium]|nr:phosphoribosyltransferase [bacterium]